MLYFFTPVLIFLLSIGSDSRFANYFVDAEMAAFDFAFARLA